MPALPRRLPPSRVPLYTLTHTSSLPPFMCRTRGTRTCPRICLARRLRAWAPWTWRPTGTRARTRNPRRHPTRVRRVRAARRPVGSALPSGFGASADLPSFAARWSARSWPKVRRAPAGGGGCQPAYLPAASLPLSLPPCLPARLPPSLPPSLTSPTQLVAVCS